jgi:hypothetical protein
LVLRWVFNRDKKVVGVFVRFRAPLPVGPAFQKPAVVLRF